MQPTDLRSVDDSGPAAASRPAAAHGFTGGAAEAHIALYYVFVEALVRDAASDLAERFLAPDFIEHGAAADRGGAEYAARLVRRRARMPGAVWTIELLASVGGLVVCHTSVAAASPARRGWEAVVARVDAGRIAECWRACDDWLHESEEAAPPPS